MRTGGRLVGDDVAMVATLTQPVTQPSRAHGAAENDTAASDRLDVADRTNDVRTRTCGTLRAPGSAAVGT